MRKHLERVLFPVMVVLLLGYAAHAQETAIYRQPLQDYNLATELLQKDLYGPARIVLDPLLKQSDPPGEDILPVVEFLDAISASEMTHPDGPEKIYKFVDEHPVHALTGEASFYLGRNYFRENRCREAIQALQQVNAAGLTREGRDELSFMLGYCQLKSDHLAAAKGFFQRITSPKSPYYGQAKYFLGHIDYVQGNYSQALKTFEQLENDRRYRKIIPLYKIQIYHYLGQNEKIMEIGPDLVEASSATGKSEIARITAMAFFNYGDVEKASYYMDIFERTARKSLDREDQFLLGFVAFTSKDFNGAIGNFQKAVKGKDALTQLAYYYLGACYNETGQKKYAGNAFLSACKTNFDKDITEESLFNYIKISLETPAIPYNEAIEVLDAYLKQNPGSARLNEGYDYLSRLYLSSKNYKQALTSLESMEKRPPGLDKTYQKILLYRAAELFNSGDMDESLELYRKTAQLSCDEVIRAEALYWSGEISYRDGDYTLAIRYYKEFLSSGKAKSLSFFPNAYYNLGYAYFNYEDYPNAIASFSNFLKSSQPKEKSLVSDANLRLGDAYFISNQFDKAIASYDKVISARERSVDAAIYYKALSEGAKGNFSGKIDILKVLVSDYPSSGYMDDAIYEIALAYVLLNQEIQALGWFDRLISDYSSSPKTVQAWLRKGFIYYNSDQINQAVSCFKYAAEKYPGTREALEALAALKNIYLESGQVEQYYAFARNLSFTSVDDMEEDSLSYLVAENHYMIGDFEKSLPALKKYVEKFPDGAYVTNALYYLGECNLKANRKPEAIENFIQAASRPGSGFTEISLVKAASLEYGAGNYTAALPLYERLETLAENPDNLQLSLVGQMRCHFRDGDYAAAAGAAQKVVSSGNASPDAVNEAHFTLGHFYLREENLEEAYTQFRKVNQLKGTETGADATYQLAWINFQTGKLKETEELVYDLAENYPSIDYWVARGFILLADVFERKGDVFQARQTLQSVIDNYTGPELGELARQKMDSLGSD